VTAGDVIMAISVRVRDNAGADWFFNTNETYAKDAYIQMMSKSVIALYGYPAGVGEHKLARPATGDRIFAHVNEKGIVAVGYVVGPNPTPPRPVQAWCAARVPSASRVEVHR
jgi:hypothetical protein